MLLVGSATEEFHLKLPYTLIKIKQTCEKYVATI